jgi:hypothetical protein
MKKDYIWFTIIGLLVFSFVLDRISGPIALNVRNPYLFINSFTLGTYPLTAVSVAAKAVALAAVLIMCLSYIVKVPYVKASLLFVLGGLAQLYAIQQLATRGQVTPTEWTLGIAFAGICLVPFVFIYILEGIFTAAHHAIIKEIMPVKHDLKVPPQNQQPTQ